MDVQLPFVGPELITAVLGPFERLELLGVGRFGETYCAARGKDEFALKVCHFLPVMPAYLWEREVTALRRVSHPNIVAFRRAGSMQALGRAYPYMECEYVEGGGLDARQSAGLRPETPTELRGFLVGLLRGVAELHDLGILHRDIKPANVALRGHEWNRPVLLDFGLAQAFTHSAAHQRLSLASRRPDLKAVAAVVYEAGTGRDPLDPPHYRQAAASAGLRRRGDPLLDPRDLSPAFSDDVAKLLLSLLSSRHLRLGADDALRELGEE